MNVKKMKKISMVVPCFNSAKYLGECFASIRNQTLGLEGIQMIFVDDASTDNTLECLREFAGAYPQSVEVVSLAENRRQGGARNAGLARAVGEYVMFLDSDDWLDHSMCEKAYSKAAEYCVDILQFCFIHVFRQGSTKDSASRYGFLDGTLSEIRKGMLLGTLFTFGSQNKLYRTSFLKEQAAAFPEGVVYEEPYFVYPLLFEAERFYSMEEGLYYYRQTEPSTTVKHMDQKHTLYNHPFVQLELLKQLISRKKYIEEYYSEIEFHFLHSYYIETLYFSGKSNKYLGADYFRNMQRTVLEPFPEYKQNPYLQLQCFTKLGRVLASLQQEFSQQELAAYCQEVVRIIDG